MKKIFKCLSMCLLFTLILSTVLLTGCSFRENKLSGNNDNPRQEETESIKSYKLGNELVISSETFTASIDPVSNKPCLQANITAEVFPSYAINKDVTWTIECLTYTADNISDHVSLEDPNSHGLTQTINVFSGSFLQHFDTYIKVSSVSNPDVFAKTKLIYNQIPIDYQIYLRDSNGFIGEGVYNTSSIHEPLVFWNDIYLQFNAVDFFGDSCNENRDFYEVSHEVILPTIEGNEINGFYMRRYVDGEATDEIQLVNMLEVYNCDNFRKFNFENSMIKCYGKLEGLIIFDSTCDQLPPILPTDYAIPDYKPTGAKYIRKDLEENAGQNICWKWDSWETFTVDGNTIAAVPYYNIYFKFYTNLDKTESKTITISLQPSDSTTITDITLPGETVIA